MRKTIWTTNNVYIDIETGEILPPDIAKREYIIQKTTVKRSHNNNEYNPKGRITRTNECVRNKQGKLFTE